MNASQCSLSCILREDVHASAYRHRASYLLDSRLEKKLRKMQKLLKRFQKKAHRRILFTDEKIFNIEEKFNRQNDPNMPKVITKPKTKSLEFRGVITPLPISMGLVTSFVLWCKANSFLFCDTSVKTNSLPSHVKLCLTTYGRNCIYRQRWVVISAGIYARSQSEKSAKWLQEHIPNFIKADDWPSSNPDLNPLNYKLWSVLKECAHTQKHQNINSLKAAIVRRREKSPPLPTSHDL